MDHLKDHSLFGLGLPGYIYYIIFIFIGKGNPTKYFEAKKPVAFSEVLPCRRMPFFLVVSVITWFWGFWRGHVFC